MLSLMISKEYLKVTVIYIKCILVSLKKVTVLGNDAHTHLMYIAVILKVSMWIIVIS